LPLLMTSTCGRSFLDSVLNCAALRTSSLLSLSRWFTVFFLPWALNNFFLVARTCSSRTTHSPSIRKLRPFFFIDPEPSLGSQGLFFPASSPPSCSWLPSVERKYSLRAPGFVFSTKEVLPRKLPRPFPSARARQNAAPSLVGSSGYPIVSTARPHPIL